MKANEFVKKYSIDKAKELVSSIINTISVAGYVCDPCFITDEGEYVGYNDLKRLVESHDLVESHGGLVNTKHDAKYLFSDWDYAPPMELRLKQAIADVENCK